MKIILTMLALCLAGAAAAKLPTPSPEAKAKADETAAKTAWTAKVADYQTCKAQDKVAAAYLADTKKAGKDVKPTATPPCADPGPFVYAPSASAPASAASAVAAKK
jgi:hypothetical protein